MENCKYKYHWKITYPNKDSNGDHHGPTKN